MTPEEITRTLDEAEVLGLTGWAEASGDDADGSSVEERIAVMTSIRNRVANYRAFRATQPTYRAVCLAPKQFSCWSVEGGRANYLRLLDATERLMQTGEVRSATLKETLYLAAGVINGSILDRTGGATSYYAPKAMVPVDRVPSWAVGKPYREIGSQRFYTV